MKHHLLTLAALLMAVGLWGQPAGFDWLFDEEGLPEKVGKEFVISELPDSFPSPATRGWFDGGVLKISPFRYETVHDTVVVHHPWVSSAEVYAKLERVIKEVPWSERDIRMKAGFDSIQVIAAPLKCRGCLSHYPSSYTFTLTKIYPPHPYSYTDYRIKPGYEDDFPKGLMEVHLPVSYQIVASRPIYEWLPLSEWDSVGKKLLPHFQGNTTFEDQEGNQYCVFPPSAYNEMREIICCCSTPPHSFIVKDIQNALKDRGYDPGPSDNILGKRTKAAITQFQRDYGLPQGNLNVETLRALGLWY